ncbi:g7188 [Coccomyxa elongata]
MGLRKLLAASRLLYRRPDGSISSRSSHASTSTLSGSTSSTCEVPGLFPGSTPFSLPKGSSRTPVFATSLLHQIQNAKPGQWGSDGQSSQGSHGPFGKSTMHFLWGGVVGASLGAAGYAGIANMKMRDWESTLTQAWKNNVGTFSVLDTITNLGGRTKGTEDASTSYHPGSTGAPLGPHSLADAAAKAAPAVVNVTLQGGNYGALNGSPSGSGVILDPDGTILTNAHIVAEASPQRRQGSGGSRAVQPTVHVALQDGRIFEGRVISTDRLSDLAIVKIESAEALPSVRLGTSAGLRVGEWVLALGSPLHLQNSVTAGIVSCVDRKAVELGLAGPNSDFIQTDAAINSGNSGGPLVNLAGEVVGISSMKALTADGVSFAIPIDTAKHVAAQLKAHGRVVRPFIGIKMLQLNESKVGQLRRADPAFPAVKAGILVPQVSHGSPAARAGLRPGDIIIGYAGQKAPSTAGLIRALAEQVGKPLELQVLRPGSPGEIILNVVAVEAPS